MPTLARLFVDTVNALYTSRIGDDARTGALTVVQLTSSDPRLNPQLHVVFLDGAYRGRDGERAWREPPKLSTDDVVGVLEATLRRIDRNPRRHGVLPARGGHVDADYDDGADQEANPALSAVSGRTPPAGPARQRRRLPQLVGRPLALDKHLSASIDGLPSTSRGAPARKTDKVARCSRATSWASDRPGARRATLDGLVRTLKRVLRRHRRRRHSPAVAPRAPRRHGAVTTRATSTWSSR